MNKVKCPAFAKDDQYGNNKYKKWAIEEDISTLTQLETAEGESQFNLSTLTCRIYHKHQDGAAHLPDNILQQKITSKRV